MYHVRTSVQCHLHERIKVDNIKITLSILDRSDVFSVKHFYNSPMVLGKLPLANFTLIYQRYVVRSQ